MSQQLREEMVRVGRLLWERRLVGATEGNISCRMPDGNLLCTPSGVCKGWLEPKDLIEVDLAGTPVSGSRSPSSELKLHLICFAERPDCQAVVHAHPPIATGFALADEKIEDNWMPEAAYVLGSVANVPFAFPGTDEVPAAIKPLLADHKTFLLENHGAVALGASLMDGFFRMETLERICTAVLVAKTLGSPTPLPGPAFDRLLSIALNGIL